MNKISFEYCVADWQGAKFNYPKRIGYDVNFFLILDQTSDPGGH